MTNSVEGRDGDNVPRILPHAYSTSPRSTDGEQYLRKRHAPQERLAGGPLVATGAEFGFYSPARCGAEGLTVIGTTTRLIGRFIERRRLRRHLVRRLRKAGAPVGALRIGDAKAGPAHDLTLRRNRTFDRRRRKLPVGARQRRTRRRLPPAGGCDHRSVFALARLVCAWQCFGRRGKQAGRHSVLVQQPGRDPHSRCLLLPDAGLFLLSCCKPIMAHRLGRARGCNRLAGHDDRTRANFQRRR